MQMHDGRFTILEKLWIGLLFVAALLLLGAGYGSRNYEVTRTNDRCDFQRELAADRGQDPADVECDSAEVFLQTLGMVVGVVLLVGVFLFIVVRLATTRPATE